MNSVQSPIADVNKLFTNENLVLKTDHTHLLDGGQIFNDWVHYM